MSNFMSNDNATAVLTPYANAIKSKKDIFSKKYQSSNILHNHWYRLFQIGSTTTWNVVHLRILVRAGYAALYEAFLCLRFTPDGIDANDTYAEVISSRATYKDIKIISVNSSTFGVVVKNLGNDQTVGLEILEYYSEQPTLFIMDDPFSDFGTSEPTTFGSHRYLTGSYNDLLDKPSIPSKTSDLTNDSGFVTANNRKSFYGTCSTAADVATKVVTLTNTAGWELTAGTIVGVSFDYSNTAESVKLNINNTGAKSIWYDGDVFNGISSYICGRYNHRTIYYMYDGTYWRWFSMGAQWPDGRVDQTATDSTNANYEIIFSGTADNTTRTETTRKSSKLTFNPSTGNLQTTQLNGVTVGSSPKFTDTTYTAATAAPGTIASSGSAGTSTNYARQDHTHGITVATGDSNGQVKIAGQNASVKGLGTAAYTASTDYAKVAMLTNQDLNDIKSPGFYNAGGGNTVANKPTGVDAFGLEVVHCAGGEYYVQLLYPSSSDIAYRRCCANNTWYAWSQDKYTDTNNRKSFYGTCDTAAATADKVVTLANTDGWELKAGTIVGVKYTYSNSASNVTININGTGAKSIYYNNSVYTGTWNAITGAANCAAYYMYDGTYWRWVSSGYVSDTSVGQNNTTTNSDYRVLLSYNANDTTETQSARKNTNFKYNPSTQNLMVPKINGVSTVYTSAVSAVVGDTTCTITNAAIATTSIIEEFCENTSGTKIAVTQADVTTGQAVLHFAALTEATSFKLRITNI